MRVGVAVARFQVDKLTDGHAHLLELIQKDNDIIVVILGYDENKVSRRNPLDFMTRKAMVESWWMAKGFNFNHLHIIAKHNRQDDKTWSFELDKSLRELFPGERITLYGGRDSFLLHYHGSLPQVDLSSKVDNGIPTGTDVRKKISQTPSNSEEFRRGVIYAAYNQWPRLFMCVDIGVLSNDGKLIYVGKRNGEDKCRFFGGFVDQKDSDLEWAANRELKEEAGCELESLHYLGSFKVNDYRYKSPDDGQIISAFYAGNLRAISKVTPGDDVDQIHSFPVPQTDDDYKFILKQMNTNHQIMMSRFLDAIKEGRFLDFKQENHNG